MLSYFYLFLLTFLFSFGGITIKTCGYAFTPFMLSFLRFFIGVIILLVIVLVRDKKVTLHLANRLILIGGAAKALQYFMENYGVMKGLSYGNVVMWPVQAVTALLFSHFLFHEKITKRALLGVALCVIGIVTVSLNGTPLSAIRGDQAHLLIVFVIGGISSALFMVSQKILIKDMGAVETNLSMFTVSSLLCLAGIFLPGMGGTGTVPGIQGELTGSVIFCTALLGGITGIGFLLQAAALKTIPVFIVTVVQSATVILSLLWAVLIFGEPVTGYIIAGTLIFFVGIVMINLKGKESK